LAEVSHELERQADSLPNDHRCIGVGDIYLPLLKMLQRLNNKTVRGRAFIVSVPDIHHVEYKEAEKVACVEIEGGMGHDKQVNWIIYSETLRGWEPPHADSEMGKPKREEILANISKSFDVLAMPHRIV
jgi:hypothetical protein